jgi:hypothetical protein
MSAKKVRIGGWVDKQLKAGFLEQCGSGKRAKSKISQSKTLALLLAEGMARRRSPRRTP